MDAMASKDAGVIEIYGNHGFLFTSHGLNEYRVQSPFGLPYGLRRCWSPSCMSISAPTVNSASYPFHPISLVLAVVGCMPLSGGGDDALIGVVDELSEVGSG